MHQHPNDIHGGVLTEVKNHAEVQSVYLVKQTSKVDKFKEDVFIKFSLYSLSCFEYNSKK